ncbi:MAG: outer membrane beta-barrel protein [Candidatus Cryptobacteroides sp.]
MKQDWTEILKNRMEGYSETPSDGVWEGIASRTGIAGQGKSRWMLPVWLYSTVGAAAVLAGALLFVRHGEPAPEDGGIAVAVVPNTLEVPDTLGVAGAGTLLVADASVAVMKAEKLIDVPPIPSESADSYTEVNIPDKAEDIVETESDDVIPEQKDEEEVDYEAEREAWARIMAEDKRKPKRNHYVGIALSASGSGKSSGSGSSPTDLVLGANPMNGLGGTPQISPSIIETQGGLTFNQPEVKTEYSHKIPVKMGLSARYGFGRFGIESGLTYSILSSDIKIGEEGQTWSKGTQTLHYLGIPLNLSFDIIDKRFFTLYVSAGGMGEKSIKGRLHKDEYENGKFVRSTDSGAKPKELQWSINAAAGFQVNILRQLGIFVEPGVSHRFANGSKIQSVYTDKPTDFSLGFGLRYDFR